MVPVVYGHQIAMGAEVVALYPRLFSVDNFHKRGVYYAPPSVPKAAAVSADKAYDAQARVIEPLERAGKQPVIPPRRGQATPREYDQHLYRARHLIENFFAKLKQFHAIATRYDKTARNFLGAIHLVAALIWLN